MTTVDWPDITVEAAWDNAQIEAEPSDTFSVAGPLGRADSGQRWRTEHGTWTVDGTGAYLSEINQGAATGWHDFEAASPGPSPIVWVDDNASGTWQLPGGGVLAVSSAALRSRLMDVGGSGSGSLHVSYRLSGNLGQVGTPGDHRAGIMLKGVDRDDGLMVRITRTNAGSVEQIALVQMVAAVETVLASVSSAGLLAEDDAATQEYDYNFEVRLDTTGRVRVWYSRFVHAGVGIGTYDRARALIIDHTLSAGDQTIIAGRTKVGLWSNEDITQFTGRFLWVENAYTDSVALTAGPATGTVTWVTATTSNTIGYVFRGISIDDHWRVQTTASGYKLIRRVAGVDTQVASNAGGKANGDTITVTLNGTSISVSRNGGAAILTATDATFQTAYQTGLYAGSSVVGGTHRFSSITGSFTWTELPGSDIRAGGGYQWRRGMHPVTGHIDVGTASLLLNNLATVNSTVRTYDPANASSPLYGRLRKWRRVRATATVGATTYYLFNQFIERLPQDYPEQSMDALVPMTLVDAFGALNQSRLKGAIGVELLADQPNIWLRFDGNLDDSSGNGHVVTGLEPTYVTGLGRGNPSGQSGQDVDIDIPNAAMSGGLTSWTVRFIASFDEQTPVTVWRMVGAAVPSGTGNWQAEIQVGDTGVLVGIYDNGSAFSSTILYPYPDDSLTDEDNRSHDIAWVHDTGLALDILYVDGVLAASAPIAPRDLGSITDADIDFPDGIIDEFAFYPVALSSERIAAHAAAAGYGLAGQTANERVHAILDLLGFPGGRDIDPGGHTLLEQDITGTDALDPVAAGERGLIYVDGAGRAAARWLTETVKTAAVGNWGAAGTHTRSITVDTADIVNVVEVTRSGGTTMYASDEESIDRDYPRALSVAVLIEDDDETQALADHLLQVDAVTVVPNLDVEPRPTLWDDVLAVEPGTLIGVGFQPQVGGPIIDPDLVVTAVAGQIPRIGEFAVNWEALQPSIVGTFRWDVAGAGWDEGTWAA